MQFYFSAQPVGERQSIGICLKKESLSIPFWWFIGTINQEFLRHANTCMQLVVPLVSNKKPGNFDSFCYEFSFICFLKSINLRVSDFFMVCRKI